MAEVRYIISEEEAQYMEHFKGHFSKKMAEWAISMMEKKDETSGKMKKITPSSLDEVEDALKQYGVEIPGECVYDALYLWNMAKADYEKTMPEKEHKARYVEETLCDPDGCPEMVLACFRAKCDVKGVPILWERMI